jgi:ParB-like chromosome segregation protein Spo0J
MNESHKAKLRLNAQTPRWTPDEDLLLAEAVEGGMTEKEIGEMLGRTAKAVNLRIVRLRNNKVTAARNNARSRKAARALRKIYKEGKPSKEALVVPEITVTPEPEERLSAPQQDYSIQLLLVTFVSGMAVGTSLFAIITGAL